MAMKKLLRKSNQATISGVLALITLGSLWGSGSEKLGASLLSYPPTHRNIAKPLKTLSANQSILIGIEPYLGKDFDKNSSSKGLNLISANRPLILRDANGIVHKSRQISINWKKVPLLKSQRIERRVIGPFASFESAYETAYKLKKLGFNSIIAHPADWEVWLKSKVLIPEEINHTKYTKIIKSEIRPFLIGSNGEYILSGPISIEAPDGLLWKNGLYTGKFLIQADAYGTWTLVEKLPLESYLEGVVTHEIGSNAPAKALETQAVLARTWALANSHRFHIDGYHLCSDTQCQVYKDPQKASENIKRAISNTSGKILTWNDKPINAFYHASNGGVSANNQEAWSMESLPYLQVKIDGSRKLIKNFPLPIDNTKLVSLLRQNTDFNGNTHKLFRWKILYSIDEINNSLKQVNSRKLNLKSITVLKRGVSGRVISLGLFSDNNESQVTLRLDEIRRTLKKLPSTLFIVKKISQDTWEFSGGGFGHGVGLSQAGAIDLAKKGWNIQRIFRHYYPGATYETLP